MSAALCSTHCVQSLLCLGCPGTHLAACNFRCLTGPPPPNLQPFPAPLNCILLSPKGIAVTLKRPGLLCLTTCIFVHHDANLFLLMLFCHVVLTPVSLPLENQTFKELMHSTKLSLLAISEPVPFCYACNIMSLTTLFTPYLSTVKRKLQQGVTKSRLSKTI